MVQKLKSYLLWYTVYKFMNQDLISEIDSVRQLLLARLKESSNSVSVLRSNELKALFERIKLIEPEQRSAYGKAVNDLKNELSDLEKQAADAEDRRLPIDITAPFAPNVSSSKRPGLLPAEYGSIHPLTDELDSVLGIFSGMGFSVVESRELDDDWHMFSSLNFPEDHPARDDYDTFMTEQTDKDGKPLIAPAHTSTMQNRVIKQYASRLEEQQPIAVVIPGRVFRNEDVDARHEHTFLQLEGVYIDKQVTIGNLIATLKTFLESYYHKTIDVKTQPFYFPFTEPSLEFSMSCPFCDKQGCQICSYSGWIELIGCGMIHPKVLEMAGINSSKFQGFAWGMGIERLVMMKQNIEDVRLFQSSRLDFLRQFSPKGTL
jgi:phenylalanyl-tRNA synthetase alpha chain